MKTTLASFQELGPQFWSVNNCIRTAHFQRRSRERGFNERLLREVWGSGRWRPDPAVDECWFDETGQWQVVLGFDYEVPSLRTVKWLSARAS